MSGRVVVDQGRGGVPNPHAASREERSTGVSTADDARSPDTLPLTHPASGEAAAGCCLLDQEGDNRLRKSGRVVLREAEEGEIELRPKRSGGAFDPLGRRMGDVSRVDDVRAVFDNAPTNLRARFLTLTIDRSRFLSPALAFQRVDDRVRKVMRVVVGHGRGIWVATIEPQTLTGDGWMHYHGIVLVPAEISDDEVRRRVRKSWVIREMSEPDPETGRRKRMTIPIGISHVETCRDAGAGALYVAKYMAKAWPAVPQFMLDSTQRFRKARFSDAFYDLLEDLHRHHRVRKPRTAPSGKNHRRRTLAERLALSGSSWHAFRVENGRKRFVGEIKADIGAGMRRLVREFGAAPIVLGTPLATRLVMTPAAFRRARADPRVFEGDRNAYIVNRLVAEYAAWHEMQERRRAEARASEGDDHG